MNVERGQSASAGHAEARVAYCLDRLEAADGFCGDLDWKTRVAPSLTLEEVIGALVAAEIDLQDYREDLEYYSGYDPLIQDFNEGWV